MECGVCCDRYNKVIYNLIIVTSAENSHCGKEYLATTEAVNITSPGYPGNYPSSVDSCETTLSADNGILIDLYFEEFDIEYHSTCRYDYLEV